MAFDLSAIKEALARRTGRLSAAVNAPGGTPVPSPAPAGVLPQSGLPNNAPQSPSMTAGPRQQLAQSQPNEAQLILKALIQRLRQNPPSGGAA